MDRATDLRQLAGDDRDVILAHAGQTGLAVFGMAALLAGCGVLGRWNHLRTEVLSQPTAVIGIVLGSLTVLTWVVFTRRHVTATRVGTVVLAVGAVADLAVYAASTREPQSAPPLAIAMLLIPFLGVLAIAFRSVDFPRVDSLDPALPELSRPVAWAFNVLAYGLGFAGLWATLSDGSSLFPARPIVAIHYGTAALGFSVVGALRGREIAALACVLAIVVYLPAEASWLLIASAAGTSISATLTNLALMLTLVPALVWLARHRATTAPLEAPVEA
jgi:hypothetical protein